MILIDTDHLSVLSFPADSKHASLSLRVSAATDQAFAVPIVGIEEEFRGWLALINRFHNVYQQLPAYERLADLIEFFKRWQVGPFDQRAADQFHRLRKQGTRVGTMDLKIASIALVHDALLLSANLRDFRRVPGLKVENWLT